LSFPGEKWSSCVGRREEGGKKVTLYHVRQGGSLKKPAGEGQLEWYVRTAKGTGQNG